ncbi:MAG: DegV family protein [Anaerolineales bacterium]|nr:DegV family protein [Anaerolineales bacterium]
MGHIAIVTESSANIPPEVVQELGIHVVPVGVIVGGQAFRDGVDITLDQVYRWQREGKSLPTTAAPSVGDFVRIYESLAERTPDVVSIHMSRRLSVSHDAALQASRLVDGANVHVLDSRAAAMAQGFMVIEAARAARAGATVEEVLARANEVASKVHLLFTLGTLKYLYRGGRVGLAAALAASMLEIRPVLALIDGRIEPIAKTRTKARAVRAIVAEMVRIVGERPLHTTVFHADVADEAETLRQTVVERFHCVELYVTAMTPVMGAHTGPGLLGTTFYAD